MAIASRCALALLLAASLGCRSGGDFRARVIPDPVPRDPRTGHAHYLIEVQSLARHAVQLGDAELPPGGLVVVPGDLGPDEHEQVLTLVPANRQPPISLRVAVPTVAADVAAEAAFPLPDLGGRPARVTAGFHAPNHRMPGRRLALDLVPDAPPAVPILGTLVRSPVAGTVLAVTTDRPDLGVGRANELILAGEDGRVWRFAHFARDSIPVLPGQRIACGQTLGRIGLSGVTSGPHLHMELVGTTRPFRR